MTQLICGIHNIRPDAKGAVVTIGNFDGVHTGHQALIKKVQKRAKALQVPAIVITFEPQPLEYFAHEKTVARLTRLREKYLALAQTGVDYVLVLPFNQALAEQSAADFIQKLLVQGLNVSQVIVGDDFKFGHKRSGDFAFLAAAGNQYGFQVEKMPTFLLDGERVSSTRIRKALEQGDHIAAGKLLGHPYTMMGKIVHGDKLGRQLGFPTANIFLHREVTPVLGIYIVRMHGIGEKPLPGVASVGIRPTVGGTRILLEVYLFNFSENIYHRHVSVEFCKKIRAEEKFDNLELLTAAMTNDALIARHYFEKRGEL